MKTVFALCLLCLPLGAQTISNLGTEPAPYVPPDPPKDNYAAAFVTTYAPVAPRVESQPAITTSFAAPQAKGDHHILKNIGKGFLIGAGIAGLAVLNVERCQIEASNYPLFLRRAAYRACSGY